MQSHLSPLKTRVIVTLSLAVMLVCVAALVREARVGDELGVDGEAADTSSEIQPSSAPAGLPVAQPPGTVVSKERATRGPA